MLKKHKLEFVKFRHAHASVLSHAKSRISEKGLTKKYVAEREDVSNLLTTFAAEKAGGAAHRS